MLRIPHDTEAEAGALGCLMIDPDVALEHEQILTADDFEDQRHRLIFQAVSTLAREKGDVLLPAVGEWIRERGKLDDIGGMQYLMSLPNSVITTAAYGHYVERLKATKIKRLALLAAWVVVEKAQTGATAEEVLQALEEAPLAVEETVLQRPAKLGDAVRDRWAVHLSREKVAAGQPTGISDLDTFLGGLRPGELAILAGRPSQGKTQLAINIARNVAANRGTPTWFFSLETSVPSVADRFISLETGIPVNALREKIYGPDRLRQQEEHIRQLEGLPIWIVDRPGITTGEIAAYCRRAQRTTALGLVIIDYLTLLRDPWPQNMTRADYVGHLAERLQLLSRQVDAPVLCLSQLSRAVEQRADKKPTLADLRDSGVIEQAAHVVMLISRGDQENVMVVDVAKQKDGPTGEVRLAFLKNQGGAITPLDERKGAPPAWYAS